MLMGVSRSKFLELRERRQREEKERRGTLLRSAPFPSSGSPFPPLPLSQSTCLHSSSLSLSHCLSFTENRSIGIQREMSRELPSEPVPPPVSFTSALILSLYPTPSADLRAGARARLSDRQLLGSGRSLLV